MTIPTDNSPKPLPLIMDQFPLVDPQTGRATDYFLQVMQKFREHQNAGNRMVPCNASGTNVITLTPLDASPLLDRYNDFEEFGFVAPNTTTGPVTMTVVPKTGTLATLKAYVTNGSAQADTGDIVQDQFYRAVFVDSLDSSSGGFVIY